MVRRGEGGAEQALPPDQETALIARFSNLAPFSRCVWSGTGWSDVETGDPALVFTVHNFSCEDETECRGWADYTAGNTAAPAALYTMRYAEGRWWFERDRRLIME